MNRRPPPRPIPELWRSLRAGYVASEPLLLSLLKYRAKNDRVWADVDDADLISSKLSSGRHWPLLDLDVPHFYWESSTEGHAHLQIQVEVPRWRWAVLMLALRVGGVHELGYTAWSLRRGANFVRLPGVKKEPVQPPETEYGWLFPRRGRSERR